jgi:hypothetical protein
VNPRCSWYERGAAYTIPIDGSQKSTDDQVPPLWMFDIDGLEQCAMSRELRRLIRGELAFNDAVSSEGET